MEVVVIVCYNIIETLKILITVFNKIYETISYGIFVLRLSLT